MKLKELRDMIDKLPEGERKNIMKHDIELKHETEDKDKESSGQDIAEVSETNNKK